MKIQQFEDKGLAHFSYAILSETTGELVIIDPARNPQPYYDFAALHQAKIVGVIETHPHADFVSSHLEIHQKTGATIYAHSAVAADYTHQPFDEGAVLEFGEVKLKSLHTPGHSPDGISIVLEHEGTDNAVFTGDTLFIGDVGRPDLRESAGSVKAKREELARQLYQSTRNKLMQLQDEVIVYPAHGAGTLCGKGLSDAKSGSIGEEKRTNPALQAMSEEAFVEYITTEQPFVPKYFSYNVDLNKKGTPAFKTSIAAVKRLEQNHRPEAGALLIDGRKQQSFKKGHLSQAFNIQEGAKFETWLGSIVEPHEPFYLIAETNEQLEQLIAKAAKIGYEFQIKGAFVQNDTTPVASPLINLNDFKVNQHKYTIVDIRNAPEVKEQVYFEQAINIPLPELRERAKEIPTDKPIVVHCAAGYRSAAGSSILEAILPNAQVYDLSEAITSFEQ